MSNERKPLDGIRNAILGSDRPFRVIEGGGGRPPTGGRPGDDETPCPVTALGDVDGVYHFLDPLGQKRQIAARELGNRHSLRGLFRGDETWLRAKFPDRKEFDDETGGKVTRVVGFQLNAAAAWLQKFCSDQGLYGDHLQLRRPGIWRGNDGLPIVHCGNAVLIEGEWQPAGARTDNQVWIAAPPTARPGPACDHSIGESFREEIQRLWKFRLGGAPHLLLGLIATAMLGTAARWRPNGFLTGEGGSGKSTLMDVLRAGCPMHAYSNNASEAGVTSLMNGRVMPIFIDESSDRQNDGADALMDLVLASASGDGTRAVRGRADGGFRTVEMAGCVLYGSVNPPSMQPQHLGRITLVELLKPDAGEDARAEQAVLKDWAQQQGPALWGRVIASAERWHASLFTFRGALARAGCAPREMDQMGALLAGWWILCREGLPGETGAREAIGMAAEFIRPASDVIEDSGPRRAMQHLLSQLVQYDGTTRQELVGMLLFKEWESENAELYRSPGYQALGRHGIRPVLACLQSDARSEPCSCKACKGGVPREGPGAGLWLLPNTVGKLFRGVRGLDGEKWRNEILRVGKWPNRDVRVGGLKAKAIWVGRDKIDDGEEE